MVFVSYFTVVLSCIIQNFYYLWKIERVNFFSSEKDIMPFLNEKQFEVEKDEGCPGCCPYCERLPDNESCSSVECQGTGCITNTY